MRLWMRSVWNRLGTERNLPEAPRSPLHFTVQREERAEPLLLSASDLQVRSFYFRTADQLTVGERLWLRWRAPGLRLKLTARVVGEEGGQYRADLECGPEGVTELLNLLDRLREAA